MPRELIDRAGCAADWLGSARAAGARRRGALDMITYGLLTEEIGRACSSVRTLLTVHDMVAHAIARWGSQRAAGSGACRRWPAARRSPPSPDRARGRQRRQRGGDHGGADGG